MNIIKQYIKQRSHTQNKYCSLSEYTSKIKIYSSASASSGSVPIQQADVGIFRNCMIVASNMKEKLGVEISSAKACFVEENKVGTTRL